MLEQVGIIPIEMLGLSQESKLVLFRAFKRCFPSDKEVNIICKPGERGDFEELFIWKGFINRNLLGGIQHKVGQMVRHHIF
jgi:hypothetical protein